MLCSTSVSVSPDVEISVCNGQRVPGQLPTRKLSSRCKRHGGTSSGPSWQRFSRAVSPCLGAAMFGLGWLSLAV